MATVADVFKALADPTRRLVLDELCERDGLTLFEIVTRLTVKHGVSSSRQAISQHLAVLEDAGLISTGRVGRTKTHRIETGPLLELRDRWTTSTRE